MEASDLTLISGDLRGVPRSLELSRQTMRTIKQNLVGAFAYNVTLIPVAAGLLYPFWGVLLDPILAAAAMAASSLTVVANALRLRGFRRRRRQPGSREARLHSWVSRSMTLPFQGFFITAFITRNNSSR